MRILTLAMLTAALPLAACHGHGFGGDGTPGIKGSGSGDTRSYRVADFTGVDLRGSDDVEVKTGVGFAVRAEGPSDELDKLKIVREGNTLRIGRIDDPGFQWNSGKRHAVKVFVTLPRLAVASIAGTGDMKVDKLSGASFSGSIAGSGDLDVAAVAVDDVDLSIAGTGDMRLAGTARQLRIDIAGTGGVDAPGLKAEGAKVSIAGTGDARADVIGPASVSMIGTGDVDLGAGAKCSTARVGTGKVRCGS